MKAQTPVPAVPAIYMHILHMKAQTPVPAVPAIYMHILHMKAQTPVPAVHIDSRDGRDWCLRNNYVEYRMFAKHIKSNLLLAKEDVRKTHRVWLAILITITCKVEDGRGHKLQPSTSGG